MNADQVVPKTKTVVLKKCVSKIIFIFDFGGNELTLSSTGVEKPNILSKENVVLFHFFREKQLKNT